MCDRLQDELVQQYQTALDALKTQDQNTPEEQVLSLLLFRDQLQSQLQPPTEVPSHIILQLQQLDQDLRAQEILIASHFPVKAWRDLLKAPPEHWWWYFDIPEKINPWDRYDWLWQALSFPVIAANASLVATMSSIFLSGGLDVLGSFAIIGQGALTFASASGAVTKQGKEFLQNVLTSLKVPRHFWAEFQLLTSLILFLGLSEFNQNLPKLSNYYVQQGNRADLSAPERLDKFQRAIRMDKSNMEAHFSVGLIYEDLLEFDKAEDEYRIALLGDYPAAHSALARRYILKDKNAEAITLLRQGFNLAAEDLTAAYILKNLGWARFNQKNFREAQTHLEQSVDLYRGAYQTEAQAVGAENVLFPQELGASHCLLAQVLEMQKLEAIANWRDCLAFANGSIPEEDQWAEVASQRLGAYRDAHPEADLEKLSSPRDKAATVEPELQPELQPEPEVQSQPEAQPEITKPEPTKAVN